MNCPRAFLLVVIILVCRVNWACSLTVKFYSRKEYNGFIEEKIVDKEDETKCQPLDKLIQIRSIQADNCVMLYERHDCTRKPSNIKNGDYSVRIHRVDKNTPIFVTDKNVYKYRDDDRGVWSFHACSQEMGGGPKLDVDLYSNSQYVKPLEKWRGVCKCENVPSDKIPASVFSIDNHGNDLDIFDEQDCQGDSMYIPAGDNDVSRAIHINGDHTKEFKSFRPGGSLDCIKLDVSINKFKFRNASHWDGVEKEVQIGTTHTSVNTRVDASIAEKVSFSATVDNLVEYSVSQAFTQVSRAAAKTGVETEAEAGVPLVAGTKLRESLEANYHHRRSSGNTIKTSVTETQRVEFKMQIEIPACHQCEVSAFVKVAQNFGIDYTAEATVSGVGGQDKLSAADVKSYLPPGFEYVKEHDDEHSVQVAVEGSMTAEFVVGHAFIRHKCKPIVHCGGNLRSSGAEYPVGMHIRRSGEIWESALSEGDLF